MKLVNGVRAMGAAGALALMAASVGSLACGCASAPRQEPVSSATVTGYDYTPAYTPGAVELYVARQDQEGACPRDLAPNIDFVPKTAQIAGSEAGDLDRWAKCLNQPYFQHTTVVLVGGDEPGGPAGLFLQRAARIRDSLVMRGVDGSRVLIGAPSAARDGGPYATTQGVRVELSSSTTLRAMSRAPRAAGQGYGVR